MSKQLLFKGLVGVFFPVMFLGGLPAQSEPAPIISQAPSKSISQQELQKFAQAVQKLQAVDQETEEKMAQAVQSEGLTPERFLEIGKKQRDQEPQSTSAVPPEELQKFDKALVKVKTIMEEDKVKKRAAVEEAGLEMQRFNQIGTTVQDDPALQRQVVEMLRK